MVEQIRAAGVRNADPGTVLYSGDIPDLVLGAGAGVLAAGHPNAAYGTRRAGRNWWWTAAPTDPADTLSWAWGMARMPSATSIVVTPAAGREPETLGGTPTLCAIAHRLATERARRSGVPYAPLLTAAQPVPPSGLIRLPHLVTTPHAVTVAWELLPPATADRLFDHLLIPDADRIAVEAHLPRLVALRDALESGWLPDPTTPAGQLLTGWAEHGHRLTTALIYRYWDRLEPELGALTSTASPPRRLMAVAS